MNQDQLYSYLAGFFDGEGSITSVVQGKYGSVTLRLYVGQKDRRPLDIFAGEFGGTVSCYTKTQVWYWQAAARSAEACLTALIPYLLVKKAQAEIALQMRGASPERRSEIHTELRRLKRVV